MNIEQQKKLYKLQEKGCKIKVDHSFYVSDFGSVFEYTEDYIAKQTDNFRRVAGEFGYRSNVFSDVPLSTVNPKVVYICRSFADSEAI